MTARVLKIFTLWFLSIQLCSAHSSVVVIPLGGDAPSFANLITVAKSGGDFDDPIAAVNSIPTTGPNAPSATNPYTIVLAPGVFELDGPLVMLDHVSLMGSGEASTVINRNVTAGGVGTPSAVVVAGSQGSISNLTIENNADSEGIAVGLYSPNKIVSFNDLTIKVTTTENVDGAIGLENSVSGGSIENLTVSVTGGAESVVGIRNTSSPITYKTIHVDVSSTRTARAILNSFSAVRMFDLRLQASATSSATGIEYDDDGSDFEIYVRDASITSISDGTARGIRVDGAFPEHQNININIFGSANGRGVEHVNSGVSILSLCRISIDASISAVGVDVSDASTPARVEHCTIEVAGVGRNGVLVNMDETAYVSNSLLIGSGVGPFGTNRCSNTALEGGGGSISNLTTTCAVPL